MKIAGEYTIDAPRDKVWEALNDIDVLARVVPGCQKLEMTGENEYEGTVKIGIQSIKGTYSGRIRLTDVQPPHHYTLIANGKSANGIVDGTGTVDLDEQDGKTLLRYGGDAKISGTLASIGQRLIEGAAKQMINQSLKALVEQIKQREAGNGSAPATDAADSARGTSEAGRATATPEAPASSSPADPPPPDSFHMPTDEVSTGADATAAAGPPASAPATHDTTTFAKPTEGVPPVQPTQPPEPPQPPVAPPKQAFERRAVVVPEDEQLKPESVVSGMVQDLIGERPWLPWVALAFLLGVLVGRRGN